MTLTYLREEFLRGIIFGFRRISDAPVISAVIVVILALGIGANAAIFSVMDAILFRSLPVHDSQSVVLLHWSAHKVPKFTSYANYGDTKRISLRTSSSPQGESFSYPFLQQVENSHIFSGVAAFTDGGRQTLTSQGSNFTIETQAVNGGFFQTLGIRSAVGRLLVNNDENLSSTPSMVLSYSCWQRIFGGSPSIIGRNVSVNGVPFTIVGVAEKKFSSMSVGHVYDVWLPITRLPQSDGSIQERQIDPTALWLLIAARLSPSKGIAQQESAVDILFRNAVLYGSKPLWKPTDVPRLTLLHAQDALVGASAQFANPLKVLLIAVTIVLLIACANVAGLLLVRGTARAREVAIRLALGASRGRLLWQMLAESLVLSSVGGVTGCMFAIWGGRLLLVILTRSTPQSLGVAVGIDWRIVVFAVILSIITGTLFGVLPAAQSLRLDLTVALRQNGPSYDSGGPRRGWRSVGNVLVILQSSLAVVVMMGAGLLIHTFTNLKNLNPGFDPHNLLTFGLEPEEAGYTEVQTQNLYRELQQEFAALPGVVAVSYSEAPLLSGRWNRVMVNNLPPGSNRISSVQLDVMPVSPGFFETFKIPLLAGRTIYQSDSLQRKQLAPEPVVVNQTFARRFFPNQNAVDLQFGSANNMAANQTGKTLGYVIVGVVHDAKYDTLRGDIQPTMYTPISEQDVSFELRTAGDPVAIIPAIRRKLRDHGRNLAMTAVMTESQQIDQSLTSERLLAKLSGSFGILALLLSCTGLYGLLSFETTRRAREIGVRMALGAKKRDIFRIFMLRGLILASFGAGLGLSVAIITSRLLHSLLYRVESFDPITLISVALLMLVVGALATGIPARHATSVQPNVALRRD